MMAFRSAKAISRSLRGETFGKCRGSLDGTREWGLVDKQEIVNDFARRLPQGNRHVRVGFAWAPAAGAMLLLVVGDARFPSDPTQQIHAVHLVHEHHQRRDVAVR